MDITVHSIVHCISTASSVAYYTLPFGHSVVGGIVHPTCMFWNGLGSQTKYDTINVCVGGDQVMALNGQTEVCSYI